MSQTSETIAITETAIIIFNIDPSCTGLNFTNLGPSTVYLGTTSSVTSADGFPIFANEKLEANDYIGDWYAICETSATSDIQIHKEVV